MNIAELGIKVDSTSASQAADDLDKLAKSGERAGQSATSMMSDLKALEKALATGAKSTQELAKQRDALAQIAKTGAYSEAELAKAGSALDKQQVALAKSAMDEQKALNSLLGAIDPNLKALTALDAKVDLLNKSFREGKVDQATYAEGMKKFDAQYASIEKTSGAFDGLNLKSRALRENITELGNAFTRGDFGGVARNIGQLGAEAGTSAGRIAALVGPYLVLAAAVGGVAYAYVKGKAEADDYNKALILTGNYAGTTSGQLGDMAKRVGSTVGTTGAAAAALAQLAGGGKIVSSNFEMIAKSALKFEEATGQAASETIGDFEKIAKDPVKTLVDLNEKYNFLTASVYEQVRALKENGDTAGAANIAETAYAQALDQRSEQIKASLGTVETAWNSVKLTAKRAWDAFFDIGREEDFQTKIEKIRNAMNNSSPANAPEGSFGINFAPATGAEEAKADGDIQKILQAEVDKQTEARKKMFGDIAIQEGTKYYENIKTQLTTTASKADQLTEALKKNKQQIAGARAVGYTITASDEARLETQTRDKFKDAKGPGNQVDLTGFNDAKNQLAATLDLYKNYQKELEASQRAGVISQAEFAAKSADLVRKERDDTSAGYEAEISALEGAKAKKGTTARQSIELDQKIADARADMVKAQKDADSELTVLALNEEARLKRQTAVVNGYAVEILRQTGQLKAANAAQSDIDYSEKVATYEREGNVQAAERLKTLQKIKDINTDAAVAPGTVEGVSKAPKTTGLDVAIGGPASEISRLNEEAKETEQWRDHELAKQAAYFDTKAIAEEEYSKRVANIHDQANKGLTKIEDAKNRAILASAGDFFGNLATLSSSGNKTLGAIGKAAAIAQATVSGFTAIQNALAVPPYPLGVALAVSAGIATAANIASIAGVGFESGGYTGAGAANEVAGVVHKGEYVMSAPAVARIGLSTLDNLHNGQMEAGSPAANYVGAAGKDPRSSQSGASQGSNAPVSIVIHQMGSNADEVKRANTASARTIVRAIRSAQRYT